MELEYPIYRFALLGSSIPQSGEEDLIESRCPELRFQPSGQTVVSEHLHVLVNRFLGEVRPEFVDLMDRSLLAFPACLNSRQKHPLNLAIDNYLV